jgi:hypothetical protein
MHISEQLGDFFVIGIQKIPFLFIWRGKVDKINVKNMSEIAEQGEFSFEKLPTIQKRTGYSTGKLSKAANNAIRKF